MLQLPARGRSEHEDMGTTGLEYPLKELQLHGNHQALSPFFFLILESLKVNKRRYGMLLSKVLGVIIIARNGDRYNYYQDPFTYAGSNTETTALGEVSLLHCPYSLMVDTWLVRSNPTF